MTKSIEASAKLDDTVTIRNRDTTKQDRVEIENS